MTSKTITATDEEGLEDHIDKAVIALERAHGVVDSLYTLEVVSGVENLCKMSLAAILDVAMGLIAEAKDEIFKEADAARIRKQVASHG